jgi:hypothetical protein
MLLAAARVGTVATGGFVAGQVECLGQVRDEPDPVACAAAARAIGSIRDREAFKVVVGFDGFVDNIIEVVDKRISNSEYSSVETINSLGARVSAAAGESANMELVVKKSKIGGNGPIM